MTIIKVILDDITKLKVDAIVNAANKTLLGGGGVDGAIHKQAGKELLNECKSLGGCKTGEAKLTKGYNLPARYVIHTVGPVWSGGNRNEEFFLESCYKNSLDIAVSTNLKTIAFACISTGVYGFPKEKAARIAVCTIKNFIKNNSELNEIIFCCFSKYDFNIYNELLDEKF